MLVKQFPVHLSLESHFLPFRHIECGDALVTCHASYCFAKIKPFFFSLNILLFFHALSNVPHIIVIVISIVILIRKSYPIFCQEECPRSFGTLPPYDASHGLKRLWNYS